MVVIKLFESTASIHGMLLVRHVCNKKRIALFLSKKLFYGGEEA
jgi:hypothetical protein